MYCALTEVSVDFDSILYENVEILAPLFITDLYVWIYEEIQSGMLDLIAEMSFYESLIIVYHSGRENHHRQSTSLYNLNSSVYFENDKLWLLYPWMKLKPAIGSYLPVHLITCRINTKKVLNWLIARSDELNQIEKDWWFYGTYNITSRLLELIDRIEWK